MTLADVNTRVSRLPSCEVHIGSNFGLDSCSLDNGECPDHRLVLTSTDFKRSNHQCVNWRAPPSSHRWVKLKSQRATSGENVYKIIGAILFECGHTSLWIKLFVCSSGPSRRTTQCWLYCAKLFGPTGLSIFQDAPFEELELHPNSIDRHWWFSNNAQYSVGSVNCGLTQCVVKPWIFLPPIHSGQQQNANLT